MRSITSVAINSRWCGWGMRLANFAVSEPRTSVLRSQPKPNARAHRLSARWSAWGILVDSYLGKGGGWLGTSPTWTRRSANSLGYSFEAGERFSSWATPRCAVSTSATLALSPIWPSATDSRWRLVAVGTFRRIDAIRLHPLLVIPV